MDQSGDHEDGFLNMLMGDEANFEDGGEDFEGLEAMRRQVLGQIQQQEAELAQLLPMVHHLREQRHHLHEKYCEKIDELEARILRAHVVPFDDGFVSHLRRHAPKPLPQPAQAQAQAWYEAQEKAQTEAQAQTQARERAQEQALLDDPSLPSWLREVVEQHPLKEGERVIGYRRLDNAPDMELGLFGYHEEPAPVSNTGAGVYDTEKEPRAWQGVAEVTYKDRDEFGNLVPNSLWYTDASKIPPCPPVQTLEPRWLDRLGKPGYNLYKYTH